MARSLRVVAVVSDSEYRWVRVSREQRDALMAYLSGRGPGIAISDIVAAWDAGGVVDPRFAEIERLLKPHLAFCCSYSQAEDTAEAHDIARAAAGGDADRSGYRPATASGEGVMSDVTGSYFERMAEQAYLARCDREAEPDGDTGRSQTLREVIEERKDCTVWAVGDRHYTEDGRGDQYVTLIGPAIAQPWMREDREAGEARDE